MIRIIFEKDAKAADALKCKYFNNDIPSVVQKFDVNMPVNRYDTVITDERTLVSALKLLSEVGTSKSFSCYRPDEINEKDLSGLFVLGKKLSFDTKDTKIFARDIYLTKAELMIVKALIIEKGAVVPTLVLSECAFVSVASIPVHVCEINRKVSKLVGIKLIKSKYKIGYLLDSHFTE